MSVLPPRRGSFYVERGTGVSVGTVLAFWCREGYQLVGSDKISCSVRAGKPQWNNFLPVCEGETTQLVQSLASPLAPILFPYSVPISPSSYPHTLLP